MGKLSLMAGILGLWAFLGGPSSWAQEQAAPAIPAAPRASKLYHPQALETLTGKVLTVNRRTARKAGRPERVTMVLQTDQGPVQVNLGPADYLDQQGLKLAGGDPVEVRGMRVKRPRATSFIAVEVRRDGQVVKLRDDATGRPLWFKGRMGNGGSDPR
jgi:hypothetical protein